MDPYPLCPSKLSARIVALFFPESAQIVLSQESRELALLD